MARAALILAIPRSRRSRVPHPPPRRAPIVRIFANVAALIFWTKGARNVARFHRPVPSNHERVPMRVNPRMQATPEPPMFTTLTLRRRSNRLTIPDSGGGGSEDYPGLVEQTQLPSSSEICQNRRPRGTYRLVYARVYIQVPAYFHTCSQLRSIRLLCPGAVVKQMCKPKQNYTYRHELN